MANPSLLQTIGGDVVVGGGTAFTLAFASNVTVGSAISLCFTDNQNVASFTVTDTLSNSYTQKYKRVSGVNTSTFYVYEAVNSSAGANTISITPIAASQMTAMCAEIGNTTSTPSDAATIEVSGSSGASTGTFTAGPTASATTVDNALAIFLFAHSSSSTFAAGTGWGNYASSTTGQGIQCHYEDKTITPTGTVTATTTWSVNPPFYDGAILTYKAAVVAATSRIKPMVALQSVMRASNW